MSATLRTPGMETPVGEKSPDRYRVGTLVYTKVGLLTLFLLLLGGDFCFTLMEAVVPSILPVKFNALGVPNTTLGLILTTIPNLMNVVINPFISFRSDRYRSKWGRRIPFLAGATPFLVIFLVLLGCSEPISRWLRALLMLGESSQITVTIIVFGVFMVCFQFFNLFVSSVYYYLFNDVVPPSFLARFMALFKIVSIGAWSFYNYFVFKYANTHMTTIFLVAGVLYLVAFSVMCWNIKEGEYPPLPPDTDKQTGILGDIKTYSRECFTHRFYWFFFLANAFSAMGWGVTGTYDVLIATKLVGMDLSLFGKVSGICGLISLVLLYPAGIIADRFHPLRVFLAGWSLLLVFTPIMIVFLFFRHLFAPPDVIRIWIGLLVIAGLIRLLAGASEMPMFMLLLPKERYGQFCSASAIIRSVMFTIGGIACGAFLDISKGFQANPDECYRFVPIWNLVFILLTVGSLLFLKREWNRLGGLCSFEPPSGDPLKPKS
ncbi:MAG: MFS transporter [Chthoniobacteraceae bacterium]